jgi:hypothetical protein
VRIACQNSWSLGQLHAAVLKAAGYVVEQSTTKTLSGEYKVNVKFGGGVSSSGVNLTGGLECTTADGAQFQLVERRLELDPSDTNDVISALRELNFDKKIVLEDFHYLEHRTQREFSQSLKAFYDDSSLKFIIIGVWLDPNRPIHFNRDLSGRITTINADRWDGTHLRLVISRGEQILNFRFHEDFVEHLLSTCFNSVWIVQEVCYEACVAARLEVGEIRADRIGSASIAAQLVAKVVNSQSAHYLHFIKAFIQNTQSAERDIYRWLLAVILVAEPERLERGVHLNEIYEFIKTYDQEEFISESTLEFWFGNHLSWRVIQPVK